MVFNKWSNFKQIKYKLCFVIYVYFVAISDDGSIPILGKRIWIENRPQFFLILRFWLPSGEMTIASSVIGSIAAIVMYFTHVIRVGKITTIICVWYGKWFLHCYCVLTFLLNYYYITIIMFAVCRFCQILNDLNLQNLMHLLGRHDL